MTIRDCIGLTYVLCIYVMEIYIHIYTYLYICIYIGILVGLLVLGTETVHDSFTYFGDLFPSTGLSRPSWI